MRPETPAQWFWLIIAGIFILLTALDTDAISSCGEAYSRRDCADEVLYAR